MAETPKTKEKAISGAAPKATDAAQRRADELDVDMANVEATGAEGQVKVEDVEKAAEAQQAAATSLVEVKILDPMATGVVAPDGELFTKPGELDPANKNIVTEKYFNEVLADAVDSEGNKLFGKGGE